MPERTPGIVVVNTTPIISLSIVGHLELLRDLYERTVVPPAVRTEALIKGADVAGVTELAQATWIETVPLRDPRRADLVSDLDRGEAEVLALAQELNASLVILDERMGRRYARRLGIRLTGTLGVLLRAKQQQLIPAVGPLIRGMQEAGIRFGGPLVDQVLRVAEEL
jgi:predicted nucleic acid-binding protein